MDKNARQEQDNSLVALIRTCMYYPPSLATFNIEIVICLKSKSLQQCRWSKTPHSVSRRGGVSELKYTGEEKTADFSQSFCSQSQIWYTHTIYSYHILILIPMLT